jgi:predicted ATPase
MVLTTLAVENYRSLRNLVVRLGRVNVVTGANGCGKSSLYRALRLLAEAARNGAVAALARQGGPRRCGQARSTSADPCARADSQSRARPAPAR